MPVKPGKPTELGKAGLSSEFPVLSSQFLGQPAEHLVDIKNL
jgi:hypothetical protein